MKNLMLYVTERGGFGLDGIRRNLDLQVDNSLELGWRPGDLLVYTNFPFSRHGVRAIEVLPGKRPRTARMTSFHKTQVLLHALDRLEAGETLWYHDADAYQLQPFSGSPAPGRDLAACLYSTRQRLLIQGGSMFLASGARPLFAGVMELLVHNRYRKDEFALTDLTGRPEFLDRFAALDYSYNLGDTDFELRYQLAERPVKVAHFHLERGEHRRKFLDGANSLGVFPLGERFERLLQRHGYLEPWRVPASAAARARARGPQSPQAESALDRAVAGRLAAR
jgi:hypothetical protein